MIEESTRSPVGQLPDRPVKYSFQSSATTNLRNRPEVTVSMPATNDAQFGAGAGSRSIFTWSEYTLTGPAGTMKNGSRYPLSEIGPSSFPPAETTRTTSSDRRYK